MKEYIFLLGILMQLIGCSIISKSINGVKYFIAASLLVYAGVCYGIVFFN